MKKPVIIIGGGGHSKVLQDILSLTNRTIIGITEHAYSGEKLNGIDVLGNDEVIFKYRPNEVELVNGIGSTQSIKKRKLIFTTFKEYGYTFATLIHPSVIFAADVELCEGVQVMAGAILQPGTKVNKNTIINTKASIDHDCIVGTHVHIAPGVTLSGNVIVGDEVHIGTSACVIQGLTIGKGSLLGAGSVVINNITENGKVVGNPAREVNK